MAEKKKAAHKGKSKRKAGGIRKAKAAIAAVIQRYILLPPRGITPSALKTTGSAVPFLLSLRAERVATVAPREKMRVVDSIAENGAKLVEMQASTELTLRAQEPGLRIMPEIFYQRAWFRPRVESKPKAAKVKGAMAKGAMAKAATAAATAKAAAKIVLTITSEATGKPVAGARVVAFTDFAARQGDEGTSNRSGKVSLALGAASRKVERLYVYPGPGLWSMLKENVTIKTGNELALHAIDLGTDDCVRFFYGKAGDDAGKGVTVGVVDSGVDLHHPDLTVSGGLNTVPEEQDNAFGDGGGEHHGTHVAGIIAAHGTPPKGARGLAPAVTLRSYRVFPATPPGGEGQGASNFSIAKAIQAAIKDGCDLINMSLGVKSGSPGQPDDDVLRSAIADARAAGVLVIVAAGNDGRKPVSFPGADPRAVAISALGRKGTFPDDADSIGDVQPPPGDDPKNFIAAFSNVGPEIDLTGPGVGVVSTIPGGYAVMSGTSMACPAVTGAIARLLAADSATLKMKRDQTRSDAIAKLAYHAAKSLGFGSTLEGHGMAKA